ncbi:MAG TPA: hypothetical protein VJT54_06425 [Verrucomicrobiae bacterium]|nr:hypothetical protein [Verrucomicrobiae bacterium]
MDTDKHGYSKVPEPLFIATERFDPTDGETWQKYFDWAKIPSLKEIVSLDGSLCPQLIKDFMDEDWNHIVKADFQLNYFCDLDYLLNRVSDKSRRNILGLYRNADNHISEAPAARDFSFIGYDLIDEDTQISALTNCGGFPDVFGNNELNSYGLISYFGRASEVRRVLAAQHPQDSHAQCELYALWRLNE